jgi:flagellar assembly protein FliH
MLCKIIGSEVETDKLIWQTLGSSPAAGPTAEPNRPKKREAATPHTGSQSASLPAAAPPASGNPAGTDAEPALLKRRISELEALRKSELERAHQAGLDQGLKQGRQEAASEMQSALDRLARTIQEVSQVKIRVRKEAENELVKLSLAIARRILHRELTIDPQTLRGVVYAALQRLQNREITRIRVFPAAVPAVRAALERNGGMEKIEISGDALLPPGGLLFETALGDLDASVETQLGEIERGFTDRLQLT